jgi:two-component system sensor histidine kinase YesM
MQAQFDTLQAQINPHFIYNVLNTISQRGMELEDETICEICSGLAESCATRRIREARSQL